MPSCCGRVNQSPISQRAITRHEQRPRHRIKISQLIVCLVLRRSEFVTHSQIESQLARDREVVLQISKMHSLSVLRQEKARQLILAACAK